MIGQIDLVCAVGDKMLTEIFHPFPEQNRSQFLPESVGQPSSCAKKFQRAFTLPADVDSDKIKAEFNDGLLQIEVPKPEQQKPKQVTIH